MAVDFQNGYFAFKNISFLKITRFVRRWRAFITLGNAKFLSLPSFFYFTKTSVFRFIVEVLKNYLDCFILYIYTLYTPHTYV